MHEVIEKVYVVLNFFFKEFSFPVIIYILFDVHHAGAVCDHLAHVCIHGGLLQHEALHCASHHRSLSGG